jgi:hypothetical protein
VIAEREDVHSNVCQSTVEDFETYFTGISFRPLTFGPCCAMRTATSFTIVKIETYRKRRQVAGSEKMMQADATAEDAMEAGVAMTAQGGKEGQAAAATASAAPSSSPLELIERGENDDKGGPCGERTLKTRIAQGVAIASFVLNILAMAWEQSVVAILAGIVACIIAPVVVYYQFLMQDTDCT